MSYRYSLLALTLFLAVVLIGCGSPATEVTPEVPAAPVVVASVDSQYCIACHTDAAVIENLAIPTSTGDEPTAGGG